MRNAEWGMRNVRVSSGPGVWHEAGPRDSAFRIPHFALSCEGMVG